MTKKIIILFICIMVITFSIYFYSTQLLNNDVYIDVKNLSIEPIDSIINNLIEYGELYNCKFTSDEIEIIVNNKNNYKIINIDYIIDNTSNSITIRDVRFYPQFVKEIQEKIFKYNTGDGTYFINIEPHLSGHLKQYIIIKDLQNDENEIFNLLLQSQVKMTYYSNNFGISNGHELTGFGKHEVIFKLSDGEVVSHK